MKGAHKSRLLALAERIVGRGQTLRPPFIVFASTPPQIIERARNAGRVILRIRFEDPNNQGEQQ